MLNQACQKKSQTGICGPEKKWEKKKTQPAQGLAVCLWTKIERRKMKRKKKMR